jgi:hypothetical protein
VLDGTTLDRINLDGPRPGSAAPLAGRPRVTGFKSVVTRRLRPAASATDAALSMADLLSLFLPFADGSDRAASTPGSDPGPDPRASTATRN